LGSSPSEDDYAWVEGRQGLDFCVALVQARNPEDVLAGLVAARNGTSIEAGVIEDRPSLWNKTGNS
jgi:Family of unknown function (DUF6461)